MKFKHKTVIVTGSGRSIGRVVALAFAKQGANVVIVSRTKKEAISVKNEVLKIGSRSIAVVADLTKEKDVKNMVDTTLKKFGEIDILINNAGLITDRILNFDERSILDVPTKKFNKIISANLLTTFLCSKHVGQIMKKQRYGKIINVSSKLGSHPQAGFGPYGSSKAGVEVLTKVLALELRDFNIQVNSISPSNSVEIKTREYANQKVKRVKPDELIQPIMDLCDSNISGKKIL